MITLAGGESNRDLEAFVRHALSDLTGEPAGSFALDEPFTAASGIDSLVVLQLVAAVEEAFQVRMPDEDFDRLRTLRELMAAAGRAAPPG